MSDSTSKLLHHHRSGHGPHILLAFHGIGQDGSSCFQSFTTNLSDYYTIYAFDLFFHGKSTHNFTADFSKNDLITKETWATTIRNFLLRENISRFDIAGFSMGGRFALATLESFSDQIDKAFLIAPDGVSEHPLYTLASRFSPTRGLFRWLMQHPQALFKTAGSLQKMGMVHSSLYRFTKQVLNTPEKRLAIYCSWVAFRGLHFHIPSLYQTIAARNIKLYLFIGKYDKLLPPSAVKKLSDLLPAEQYLILQSGHAMLVEKTAALLPELLAY
jgi:pimeloyl-ACP methyl ester carboxylesterase